MLNLVKGGKSSDRKTIKDNFINSKLQNLVLIYANLMRLVFIQISLDSWNSGSVNLRKRILRKTKLTCCAPHRLVNGRCCPMTEGNLNKK